jgi:hypothetical protein
MTTYDFLQTALQLLSAALGAGLVSVGYCRLQYLSLQHSKLRWIVAYLCILVLGTAAAFEPLTTGLLHGWWRVAQAVVLAGLLWAVWRTRRRWRRGPVVEPPADSNRAPLGDV